MTRDYRDAAIEVLADSEVALREQNDDLTARLVTAEAARDAYRLVAIHAVYRLCDLRKERDSLEERYHRSLDHARELRAHVLQFEREGSSRAA